MRQLLAELAYFFSAHPSLVLAVGTRRSIGLCDTELVAVVWYSSWQMECCGEPFSVGDVVAWSLAENPDVEWLEPVIGRDLAALVTHQEDHHALRDGAATRRARVLGIRCAYSSYAPGPDGDERTLRPVAGTAEIVPAQYVGGSESTGSKLHLNGYLVDLELALDD